MQLWRTYKHEERAIAEKGEMGTAASKNLANAAKTAASKVNAVADATASAAGNAAKHAAANGGGPLAVGSAITSSSQRVDADAKKEEYEAIMRRVNQRPGLFRRLDQDDSDVGSMRPEPKKTDKEEKAKVDDDDGQSVFKTRLPVIDAQAAEVAKEVQQKLSNAAGAEPSQSEPSAPPDVSVRRLKPSRRLDDKDAEASQALHSRDDAMLRNLEKMLGPLPTNGQVPPKQQGSVPNGKVVSLADLAEEEDGNNEPARKTAAPGPNAVGQAALVPEILSEKDKKLKITSSADFDSPGARSFAIFEAMQLNPKLLDTSAAIASSPALLIAAQMAAGIVPPSANGDTFLALPAGTTNEDVDGGVLIPGGVGAVKQLQEDELKRRQKLLSDGKQAQKKETGTGSGDAADDDGFFSSLVAVKEASIDALVPTDRSIDQLLLAKEPQIPKGMTKWGPRPPDSSAYDQLILHPEEEEFALERGEIFELYARHKADPDYWTPERLADKYDTKPEWVEVLLQYASPPLFVQVDGQPYGVFAIRSYQDLHKQDTDKAREAREAADAAAAAASASGDYEEGSMPGQQMR